MSKSELAAGLRSYLMSNTKDTEFTARTCRRQNRVLAALKRLNRNVERAQQYSHNSCVVLIAAPQRRWKWALQPFKCVLVRNNVGVTDGSEPWNLHSDAGAGCPGRCRRAVIASVGVILIRGGGLVVICTCKTK